MVSAPSVAESNLKAAEVEDITLFNDLVWDLPVLKLDPIGAVQVLQLVLPPAVGHNTVSS